LWKLKLILENFISILKPFILLNVFYAQPKIINFGVRHGPCINSEDVTIIWVC
jgi:hypothetical protein